MNLKRRQIGLLFTFLAGLIILLHAVVPHDHHYDYADSFELESIWENFDKNKNTENQNLHCHVFNDLISEKTTNSSLNQPLPDFYIFYLTGINSHLELPLFNDVSTIFLDYLPIFINQFFSTAQSLRAPPSNA